MKNLLNILFIPLFLFSCSTQNYSDLSGAYRTPSSESILLPEFRSDEDKMKFLFTIHKEIPGLFADAARYDIDLLKLLDEQGELQKALINYPEFQSDWEKKKLIEMSVSIEDKVTQLVGDKKLSEQQLIEWRNGLRENAEAILKSKKDLKKMTREIVENSQGPTSAGFLNGLILNLPKNLQVEAREQQKKLNGNSMRDFLMKNLPAELKDFKSNPPEKSLLSRDLIARWTAIYNREKMIGPLIDLSMISQNRNLSLKEVLGIIDNLDGQDLINLADPDYQRIGFNKLFDNDNAKIPAQYLKYLKAYQVELPAKTIVAPPKLAIIIKEQNPNIAIFRGCTGGDCSTQYSFPYPNDPNERVFFIYDKDQNVKGYANTIMVTDHNGKKNLYVNTISGSHVGTNDTELILQGLFKERAALGVENIVIPNASNLAALVNFLPVMEVYKQAASNGEVIDIIYNDQELRKNIESYESEYNEGGYDHMQRNDSGVIYRLNENNKINISTKISEVPLQKKYLKLQNIIEPYPLLEFYLALEKSGREDLASQVLSLVPENEKSTIASIVDVINLKKTLTTAELDDLVQKMISDYKLSPKKSKYFSETHFLNAYLLASDATDAHNIEKHRKRLVESLKIIDGHINENGLLMLNNHYELYGALSKEEIRAIMLDSFNHDVEYLYRAMGNSVFLKIMQWDDLLKEYVELSKKTNSTHSLMKIVEMIAYVPDGQKHKNIVYDIIDFSIKNVSWNPVDYTALGKSIDILNNVRVHILSKPYVSEWKDLSSVYSKMIEFAALSKGPFESNLISDLFVEPSVFGNEELFLKMIRSQKQLNEFGIKSLSESIMSKPHTNNWKISMIEIMKDAGENKQKSAIDNILKYVFSQPEKMKAWPDLYKLLTSSKFDRPADFDNLNLSLESLGKGKKVNGQNCVAIIQSFL